ESGPRRGVPRRLDGQSSPRLHSVRKALHWAGHLWRYLAKRWLRLVVPTDDPNRGRWPEHPTWAALRGAFPKLAPRGAPDLPDKEEAQRELVRAARYSGYRRLLDRIAVGLLTTEQAMDTDPWAALVTCVAYLHRIAGRIRRLRQMRARRWAQHQAERKRAGKTLAIAPDLTRGMGARVDTLARLK